jgi:hypothetical protein
MRAELTIAALTMAIQRRRPGAGLIHHSDSNSAWAVPGGLTLTAIDRSVGCCKTFRVA